MYFIFQGNGLNGSLALCNEFCFYAGVACFQLHSHYITHYITCNTHLNDQILPGNRWNLKQT
jgi:hypothetical protein